MNRLDPKRKIDKILIVLFAALLVTIIAQLTLFKDNKLNTGGNGQQQEQLQREISKKEANKVLIDFGNGRKINQAVVAETPYKALEIIAANKGFKITTKQYKYGLMVEEVNKVKNTGGKYWAFFINDKPGKIAADRYILTPSDIVQWKYISVK